VAETLKITGGPEAIIVDDHKSECPKCKAEVGGGYGLAYGGMGAYEHCTNTECDWFIKWHDEETIPVEIDDGVIHWESAIHNPPSRSAKRLGLEKTFNCLVKYGSGFLAVMHWLGDKFKEEGDVKVTHYVIISRIPDAPEEDDDDE